MSSSLTVLSVLFAAVVLAATSAAAPMANVCLIFSRETNQFLQFTPEGEFSADGPPLPNMFVHYSPNNLIRIEAVKSGEPCFLTYDEEGKFMGAVPENDNDIFEMVIIRDFGVSSWVAFRAVNIHKLSSVSQEETEGSGEEMGSGAPEEEEEETATETVEEVEEEEEEECFLGFSEGNKPACFSTTDAAATRFIIIH